MPSVDFVYLFIEQEYSVHGTNDFIHIPLLAENIINVPNTRQPLESSKTHRVVTNNNNIHKLIKDTN